MIDGFHPSTVPSFDLGSGLFDLGPAGADLAENFREASRLLEDPDRSNDAEAVRRLLSITEEVAARRGATIPRERADALIERARRILALAMGL